MAAILAVLAVSSAGFAAPNQSPPPPAPLAIAYEVSAPEGGAHLVDVRMRIGNVPAKAPLLDVELPVWAPGSYVVREFARHVQDERATVDGDAAPIAKTRKNTWRIPLTPGPASAGVRTVVVSYRVYANDLSVRTSHVDTDHLYLNGSNIFMYVAAAKSAPLTLEVELPADWKVATGLERVGTPPVARGTAPVTHTFAAPNYDTLADCPIEAAPDLQLFSFEVLGKPHEIAVWGRSNVDTARLAADTKKVVETTAAVFGNDLPYDCYVFILQFFPGGGGGLEHANSTVCQAAPWGFQSKESYREFLELLAHEYFHLWLVKRIHPPALGPFDYAGENYTRMLWLMEGTPDYYASLVVNRAGLMTDDDYWRGMAKLIQQLERTPGRKRLSLEEASFDAWIKFYRQNEHSVNNQVSYYLKGAIVTAMLDYEIRGRTKGAKSFDDVLRALWTQYGKRGVPVPEDGVEPVVEAVAGSTCTDFFDRYVRGRADIDYNAFLANVGRKLVAEAPKNDDRITPSAGAWLGATLTDSGGRTVVATVLEGSPAWRAGLSVGDEVLAIDGVRVTAGTMDARLWDRAPGSEARLTIFRRDLLRDVRVVLDPRPADTFRIEKLGEGAPR